MNDNLFMLMISCLPRKHVGRMIGFLAGWEGSSAVSRLMVREFIKKYHINVDEVLEPIENYPDLRSFFVRRLKPGVRPVDPSPETIVSPVDGIVAHCGPIDRNVCLQIKGKTYTVDDLLGGETDGRPFHDGYHMTLYLSPGHYHRIHAPIDGDIVRYHHIPGHLFPVNPPSVRSVDRLFAINERVISYIRMNLPGGPEVAVVKVGAIGVGRITLTYSDRITNRPGQFEREERLHPPYPIRKGDEIGAFELGSTVVLLFPPALIEPDPLKPGLELKMGQKIAALASGK